MLKMYALACSKAGAHVQKLHLHVTQVLGASSDAVMLGYAWNMTVSEGSVREVCLCCAPLSKERHPRLRQAGLEQVVPALSAACHAALILFSKTAT